MKFLTAILFGVSANLDNLVIGTSYEISNKRITLFDNFLIAIIGTIGTFLSMSIGTFLSKLLPNEMANLLGAFVLILMGVYFTFQSILNKNNDTKSLNNSYKNISFKATIVLAIGLTLNNLGVGVASSVTGLSIPLVCIFNFIFSIGTIILGQSLGDHVVGKLLGKYSGIISGIILIILGTIECF